MEGGAIGKKARKLALQIGGQDSGRDIAAVDIADERLAVLVDQVEIGLIDDLAIGIVGIGRRVGVGRDGVQHNAARPLDVERPAGRYRDVASSRVGRRIRPGHQRSVDGVGDRLAGRSAHAAARADKTRRVENHLPLRIGIERGNIDGRPGLEVQRSLHGAQLDGRAVLRIDRLAVTIGLQHAAMGVEHRGRREREIAGSAEPDRARCRAGGVDQGINDQRSAIDRNRHIAGPDGIFDDKVAGADVEAEAAEEAAAAELAVQACEVTDPLRRDREPAANIAHSARAVQRAGEDRLAVRCGRGDGAGVVVHRRDVDQRAGGLPDRSIGAGHHQIAAPAIFGHIEEDQAAAGEIDVGACAQVDLASGVERELAGWQRHCRVQGDAGAVERERPANAGDGGGRARGRASRRRDDDGAAGGETHGRPFVGG